MNPTNINSIYELKGIKIVALDTIFLAKIHKQMKATENALQILSHKLPSSIKDRNSSRLLGAFIVH